MFKCLNVFSKYLNSNITSNNISWNKMFFTHKLNFSVISIIFFNNECPRFYRCFGNAKKTAFTKTTTTPKIFYTTLFRHFKISRGVNDKKKRSLNISKYIINIYELFNSIIRYYKILNFYKTESKCQTTNSIFSVVITYHKQENARYLFSKSR